MGPGREGAGAEEKTASETPRRSDGRPSVPRPRKAVGDAFLTPRRLRIRTIMTSGRPGS